MKSIKKAVIVFSFVLVMAQLVACGSSSQLQDGYYTAEMSDYSHGWKEYLCIMVKDSSIISAEYNAKNESGFIKAWDNDYMRRMNDKMGTYPNDYTRRYVRQILESQSSNEIDMVSGASSSGGQFLLLSEAVIERAIAGNPEKIIIEAAAE
jgi:major membrane immunogen (membrane-anchored lipoprotein)